MDEIILQVVGFKNSGKTTLLEKINQYLCSEGLQTVVLKHHGHGGNPDFGPKNDSLRHFQAGAKASFVEGEQAFQIIAHSDSSWGMERKLKLLKFFEPDIILIEGYKYENHPKIVLIRVADDLPLLSELINIKAILYWPDMEAAVKKFIIATPKFSLNDSAFFQWLHSFCTVPKQEK